MATAAAIEAPTSSGPAGDRLAGVAGAPGAPGAEGPGQAAAPATGLAGRTAPEGARRRSCRDPARQRRRRRPRRAAYGHGRVPGGQAAGGAAAAPARSARAAGVGRPVGHGSRCDERHGACRGRRGGHQRGRVERGSSPAELGRVRPAGRVTRQRLTHERQQRRGEAVQVGLPVDDPVEDRLEGAGAERRAAGGGERHRGSPRVHVGGGPARLPLDHLGREVAGRAHEHAGLGEPGGVGDLGDPEVDHDRLAIGDHDVARLEIAVHHASRVHRGQGQGQSRGQPGQLRRRSAGRPGRPRPRASGRSHTWSRCTADRWSRPRRAPRRRTGCAPAAWSRPRGPAAACAFGSAAIAGRSALTATRRCCWSAAR